MNIFNDSVGLYFYSALLQGNLALVAVVGVFAVFKLQLLESKLESADTEVIRFTREHIGPASWLNQELLDSLDSFPILLNRLLMISRGEVRETRYRPQIVGDANALLLNSTFARFRTRIGLLFAEQSHLKHGMNIPLIWTLVVVAAALILLPLAPAIHCYSVWLEGLMFSVVIAANLFALYLNYIYIRYVMRDSRSDRNLPE